MLATGLIGFSRPDDIQPLSANTGRFVVKSISVSHVAGTIPDMYAYEVKDTQGSNDFVVFSCGSSSASAMPVSRPAVKLEDNK